MHNLKLPICPKCNDTKFVVSENIDETKLSLKSANMINKHKGLVHLVDQKHHCTKCNISWDADRGTIIKEDGSKVFL